MARIFISYKRKDKRAVFKIKEDIERHIGEKCWIDLKGIESDAYFVDVIMSAINQADVFLFMYSKRHSEIIDTKKDWTVRELNFAEKKEKKIVFINLDNSKLTDYFEMMYGLKQQVYADSEDAMNNLYVDLSKWLKIDCFPNVLPDNKEWNLGKIKKLWNKFKIFFRIRFLFVLLICFFWGAVYLYNYFHQEKHIIPEPDKFEQEMVISNFNRALYMSDINAINMFDSAFYWLKKMDSVGLDNNLYEDLNKKFVDKFDSIYGRLEHLYINCPPSKSKFDFWEDLDKMKKIKESKK